MLIFVLTVFQLNRSTEPVQQPGGAPLHPPARPLAAIHHLRVLPLDLCPAAACTVHLLTDEE